MFTPFLSERLGDREEITSSEIIKIGIADNFLEESVRFARTLRRHDQFTNNIDLLFVISELWQPFTGQTCANNFVFIVFLDKSTIME